MRKWFRASLILLILGAGSAYAEENAPSLKTAQLSNGLQVIVKEDDSTPLVYASVWYKVGGSYEPDGETGLSHLLEHLMFRGETDKHKTGAFDRALQSIGAVYNAMTTADFTAYHETLPAQSLKTALSLEAERMNGLKITDEGFKAEQQVVMEEARLRTLDNPIALMYQRMNAAAFLNNPYHNPVVGWMVDLINMKLEMARNWYHTWYHPNNAVVIIVGNVKASDAFKLVKKTFGSIPAKPVPVLSPRTETKSFGIRTVNLNLPASTAALMLSYNVPNVTLAEQAKQGWEPYALLVLSEVLAGGDSSRLAKSLVRGQQLAAGFQNQYDPFSLHGTVLGVLGIPAEGKSLDQLEPAMLAIIDGLKTQPLSPEELAKVKAQVIASNVYDKDSLEGQAQSIGVLAMSNLPLTLDDQLEKNIEAVTPEQVMAVANKYLTDNHLTVARLKPTKIVKQPSAATTPMGGKDAIH